MANSYDNSVSRIFEKGLDRHVHGAANFDLFGHCVIDPLHDMIQIFTFFWDVGMSLERINIMGWWGLFSCHIFTYRSSNSALASNFIQ